MAKIKYQGKQVGTRIGRNGKRHLIDKKEEYAEQIENALIKAFQKPKAPETVAKEIEKFRDKPAFQYSETEISPELQEKLKRSILAYTIYLQNLERKIRDGYARREAARQVREAKTPAEKRRILEEFHSEPSVARKQTALKLECMKEIRAIRRKSALSRLLINSAHPVNSGKEEPNHSVEKVASNTRKRWVRSDKDDR